MRFIAAILLIASSARGQSLFESLACHAATNGIVISGHPTATVNRVCVSVGMDGVERLAEWDVPGLPNPSLDPSWPSNLPASEVVAAWRASNDLYRIALAQAATIPRFTNSLPEYVPPVPMFVDLVEPTNYVTRWSIRPDGLAEQITPHDRSGRKISRTINLTNGIEIIEPSNPFSSVTGTPSNIRALLDQVNNARQVKTNKVKKVKP